MSDRKFVKDAVEYALMAAISDRSLTQRDIASRYSDVLFVPGVDWSMVNRAILSRYKRSGLIRIKEMAWDMAARKAFAQGLPEGFGA